MKKTTCKDLRGVCDAEIQGNTVEEMGQNSKKHVMQMIMKGDKEHITAVKSMKALSKEEQEKWYEEFKNHFESLPEA